MILFHNFNVAAPSVEDFGTFAACQHPLYLLMDLRNRNECTLYMLNQYISNYNTESSSREPFPVSRRDRMSLGHRDTTESYRQEDVLANPKSS